MIPVDRFLGFARRSGLIVDTNILLFYCIATFDSELALRFKRTRTYVADDYEVILSLFKLVPRLIALPNIWTEVSNLAAHLDNPKRSDFFRWFAKEIRKWEEDFITSVEASGEEAFRYLYLTDSAILKASVAHEIPVLTDDRVLAETLLSSGAAVMNFNYIREFGWAH